MFSDFRTVFLRDLAALRREVELYPDEAGLWAKPPGVPNAAGNLVMHLVGNLRHFIGAQMGASGYVRDREREFGAAGVPRAELLAEIDACIRELDATLSSLPDARLLQIAPNAPQGITVTASLLLLHLSAHFGYHLGQVDYHRRMVTGDARGAAAVDVTALAGSA